MSDNNDWNSPPGAPPSLDSLPGEGEGWGDEHEPQALHDVDNQQWGVAPPPSGPPSGPPTPGNAPGAWTPPAGGPPTGPPPGGPPAGGPPAGGPPGAPQSPYGQQPPQGHMMRPPPTSMQSAQLDNNDAVALIANFFIPGVGYFMLGQSQKGIATLLLTFFTCGLSYLAVVVIVYDAYMVAMARKNRPVGEWEFFPK